MKIKLERNVIIDGRIVDSGEVVTVKDEALAKSLVERGDATEAAEVDLTKKKKS